MSSTVSPVGIAPPTPIPQTQQRQLCFSPLVNECKDLANENPILFSGLVTSLGGFVGSLCSKSTLKFLPLTFVPVFASLIYELLFSHKTSNSNNEEGPTVANELKINKVYDDGKIAA